MLIKTLLAQELQPTCLQGQLTGIYHLVFSFLTTQWSGIFYCPSPCACFTYRKNLLRANLLYPNIGFRRRCVIYAYAYITCLDELPRIVWLVVGALLTGITTLDIFVLRRCVIGITQHAIRESKINISVQQYFAIVLSCLCSTFCVDIGSSQRHRGIFYIPFTNFSFLLLGRTTNQTHLPRLQSKCTSSCIEYQTNKTRLTLVFPRVVLTIRATTIINCIFHCIQKYADRRCRRCKACTAVRQSKITILFQVEIDIVFTIRILIHQRASRVMYIPKITTDSRNRISYHTIVIRTLQPYIRIPLLAIFFIYANKEFTRIIRSDFPTIITYILGFFIIITFFIPRIDTLSLRCTHCPDIVVQQTVCA